MPYTKAQLDRIMSVHDQHYVPTDILNYAGRICESYVRLLTYQWEDESAFSNYHVLNAAYADIRDYGLQLAHRYDIGTLANDESGIRWRRELLLYAEPKIVTALAKCAYDAYQAATVAYTGGYAGRLWLMDQAMHGTVTVNKPQLNRQAVAKGILQPTLTEAVTIPKHRIEAIKEYEKQFGITSTEFLRQWNEGVVEDSFESNHWFDLLQREPLYSEAVVADYGGYQVHGHEWQQAYHSVASNAIIKLRRATTNSLTQGDTVNGALRSMAAVLGVGAKPGTVVRGTYYETQLITRAAIMRASNHGSAEACRVQDAKQTVREATETTWLLGVIWLTSNDDRVCPICDRLNGKVFVINSLFGIALLGLPPDGSHYGCRCSMCPWLIPVDGEANTPPDDTFDDWLDDEGWGDDLGAFAKPKKLTSTQV